MIGPLGTFRVRIEVGDPERRRFETVAALVDTGATHTTLPAELLRSLGVVPHRKARFELADGSSEELDIGRAWVRVEGRLEHTLVAFGPEGVPSLLGATTLEEMHLAVDPVRQRLVPTNPLLLELAEAR
jgi:clan AA aspartic protease